MHNIVSTQYSALYSDENVRIPGITKEETEKAWQRVHDDLIGVGPQLRTVESLQIQKECLFSELKNLAY